MRLEVTEMTCWVQLRSGFRLWAVVIPIFLGVILLGVAAAQDEGLYAPAPPADAAFVRVLNAGAGEVTLRLGDTDFEALAYGEVSPYRVVLQGTADLSAGDVKETVALAAGRFYTVVLTDVLTEETTLLGGAVTLLEDPTLENRARTLLLLYNVSAQPVNLKTADGETDVIPDVAPGEHGSVEVNPISVAFGAFAGGAALTIFDEVQLGRGAAYSTFVLPDDTAIFVQNTTATD